MKSETVINALCRVDDTPVDMVRHSVKPAGVPGSPMFNSYAVLYGVDLVMPTWWGDFIEQLQSFLQLLDSCW